MARRRFFVDRIEGGISTLQGSDAHHLAKVLRAEPGQRYEITDGSSLWLAEVESSHPREVVFRLVEPLEAGAELPPIVVIAALIKFDRFEWMVEKVTELGVKSVIPVETARSEAGLMKAAAKRVDRWRKIARESSQQSRRVRIPEVLDPVPLNKVMRETFPVKIRLEETAGAPILFGCAGKWDGKTDLAIAVGPEGGWTDAERTGMGESGWESASLGATVLRAETAVIAAAAILNQIAAMR